MSEVAVDELVAAARDGDEAAWYSLVDRYLPLVRSVIRRYRLPEADGEDVNQTVWLKLVEHLGEIREPRALPKWIITTTRHEALRVIRLRRPLLDVDPQEPASVLERASDEVPLDVGLLQDERHQALRDALAELAPRDRDLLLLLVADPPVSYDEISRRLGMPVGSIGPTRARCLRKLRATAAMQAYADDEPGPRAVATDRGGTT